MVESSTNKNDDNPTLLTSVPRKYEMNLYKVTICIHNRSPLESNVIVSMICLQIVYISNWEND